MEAWEAEKWKEMPVSLYSMMSMVGLHNDREGFAVLTNGLREYEVVGDDFDTLAITLMRGVGVLGKEKLYTRPGRPSGIKMLTPDSQMRGRQTYELALFSHRGSSVEGKAFEAAKSYATGLDVYNKIPFDAMKLNKKEIQTPASFGLFELSGEAVLSAVKESEDGQHLVIRLFNPHRDRELSASLKVGRVVEAAMLAKLNEEVLGSLPVVQDVIHVTDIKPCQAKTILVKRL